MSYHPDLAPPQPATVEHALLFHKALKLYNRRGNAQVASSMLTIDPNTPKLGLKPLPEMWWEDDEGNKFVPDFTKNEPDFPPEGVYKYAHSRFPLEVLHNVYKVRDDGGYGGDDKIMGMGTSLGGSSGDLAIAMRMVEGISLSEALGILSTACERCHNILAHHYGFDDGYAKDSEEAARSGTHCELCRQIDPQYDEKVREQDAGLYGPNIITASLNLNPRTLAVSTATRFLGYLSFASFEETERVVQLAPDAFQRMVVKHALTSELAALTQDERNEFSGYMDTLQSKLKRDPSTEKARVYLKSLGDNVELASDSLLRQTNAFIRYLTLCTLSSPEKATVDQLIPLREDCNAFLQRFRYTKASLAEVARQTLFKFDQPASVLGYQQTLLRELSRCVLHDNPAPHRSLVLAHLKYLQDPDLPALIHNP